MNYYTATELKQHLDTAETLPLLLDVREPWEFELCHIAGSRLVPMGQIEDALDSLDAEQEIVVICHHGRRSEIVADYLQSSGFKDVANLAGGVEAWAEDIDPTMARY